VIESLIAWLVWAAWQVAVWAWWQAPVFATILYTLAVAPYVVAFLTREARV